MTSETSKRMTLKRSYMQKSKQKSPIFTNVFEKLRIAGESSELLLVLLPTSITKYPFQLDAIQLDSDIVSTLKQTLTKSLQQIAVSFARISPRTLPQSHPFSPLYSPSTNQKSIYYSTLRYGGVLYRNRVLHSARRCSS